MIAEARLPEGRGALICPVLPIDRDALRAAYADLSPQSRQRRFLSSVPQLTEAMLDHLVDDVDGVDHVALASVLDDWQGRGVATALLPELLRERPAGVTRIVTTVAADNVASLAMLRSLGPTTVTPAGIDRLDVVVDLTENESSMEEQA